MKHRGLVRRWLARTAPGVLLIATVVDDALFGGAMVAARLAFGVAGLLAAAIGFAALSVVMAAVTAWALRTEPLRLSARARERITALRDRRLGRLLIPHPDRPVTTALAAAVFGSVAPIIVAALDPPTARQPSERRHGASYSNRMVLVSGLAYGLAFAAGYGLLGAIIGAWV